MHLKIYSFLVILFLTCFACKKDAKIVQPESNGVPVYSKFIYRPGATIYDATNSVRMIVGDDRCPLILSSPHDGTLQPSSMPVRDDPSATLVRDLYLTDLTIQIANSFYEKTGLRPHIVINDVSRSRLETNRTLDEAYLKSNVAVSAWKAYHDFLIISRQIVSSNVGRGLYIDMHGHGHTKQRIEVGYLLSRLELNADNDTLDKLASSSSIAAIGLSKQAKFSALIRGDLAFGTLLADLGLPAVPSKQDPKPNADEYFNGGYCTYQYGSVNGGQISSFQLETNGVGLRNTLEQRKASAPKFADAIIEYFKLNLGLDLRR